MGNLLEIRNLITNFYTYEGVVKALNDVSIDIERDITFGLVGESGCGKSVTVRSIMRIIQPPGKIESGQIRFYNDASNSENSVDLLQQSDAYMQKVAWFADFDDFSGTQPGAESGADHWLSNR